jgi:hypothetical protein
MDLDAMSGNCSEWLLWAWMTDEAISEANFLERDLNVAALRRTLRVLRTTRRCRNGSMVSHTGGNYDSLTNYDD